MDQKRTLSAAEADRAVVIQAVAEGRLKQVEAARQLGLTARQVRRLSALYAAEGAAGLASRRRGQAPGNQVPAATKAAVLARLRERYADFPPTLAREKLVEEDGYRISKETVRKWMVEAGLWQAKRQKKARVHQLRKRRPRTGELVQIDGSPHAWLEERGPQSSLVAFVDDATSMVLTARFWPTETTEAYMRTLGEDYLPRYGRPVALYSDRYSVFRVNQEGQEGERTQFTRALEELGIQPIHAHSPQAKGRVERAFSTLQQRLTRELRLRGVDTLEAANAWLPEYLEDYNRRFGKLPDSTEDAHRPTELEAEELALIQCPQYERTLTKNLTFQYANKQYGLRGYGKGYRLRGAKVIVCERYSGEIAVLRNGQQLACRLLEEGPAPIPCDDDKSVNRTVDLALGKQRGGGARKPAASHPWRQRARAAAELAEARREGST